ncbi:MAG: hypothetical protein ABI885_07815 [Gammaproteobacteria bacterium]
MWKYIRVTLLLLLLLGVAGTTWLDRVRTTSWKDTVWVGIFPLNADGSEVAEHYIERLKAEDFASIEEFFTSESARYGVRVERPIRIELYPEAHKLPPVLERGAGPLATAWWSLKTRWFARQAGNVPGRVSSHIRVFVLYHDPALSEQVPHSLGLQKGLIGVVHAFADDRMRGQNSIVIAHETMHTVGATDKYDLAGNGQPLFPDGYAEPDRKPRYPQPMAEIMAGQRPLSPTRREMPDDLRDVAVGQVTAREIGWVRP